MGYYPRDSEFWRPPSRGRVFWQIPNGIDWGARVGRVVGYRVASVDAGLWSVADWLAATNDERQKSRSELVRALLEITPTNDDRTPVCWLCGHPDRTKRRGRPSAPLDGLVVDHDHTTGVIRGLLCGVCNAVVDRLNATAFRTPALDRYIDGPKAADEWGGFCRAHEVGAAPLYCGTGGALPPDATGWAWPAVDELLL